MTQKEILDFLRKHRELFASKYHIEKIGLFGSYARNEAGEESDIDLVIQTPVRNFRNRYELKYFLEENLKRPVDIGYLDTLRPFVRKRVEREVIYV
jgi:predicted nucleotidyltransferase